jgi:hypothetical protein
MADLLTANNCVDRVRYFIDEVSEKNFSTDSIMTSLNIGQRKIQQEMMKLDVGYFEVSSALNPSGNPPGTVAGVQEYSLPGDFLSFKRVSDGITDAPIDPKDLNERYISPFFGSFAGLVQVTNLAPLGYYITANAIGFIPIPQGNYPINMVYVQRIPTMTLGTDVPSIPLERRDWMCIEAAIDALGKDESNIGWLVNKAAGAKADLMSELTERQHQMPRGVTRTGLSW